MRNPSRFYRSTLATTGVVLLIAALAACGPAPEPPSAPPEPAGALSAGSPALTAAVSVPEAIVTQAAPSLPGHKPSDTILAPELVVLLETLRAGNHAGLAELIAQYGGDPGTQSVRVILEMGSEIGVQSGQTWVEVITREDGTSVRIEHAPEVTLPPALASAITATGGTVETAFGSLIQALVPIEGLEPLSRVPGVNRVRLAHPAGAQGSSN